jgi:hypothetical protein
MAVLPSAQRARQAHYSGPRDAKVVATHKRDRANSD